MASQLILYGFGHCCCNLHQLGVLCRAYAEAQRVFSHGVIRSSFSSALQAKTHVYASHNLYGSHLDDVALPSAAV